MQDRLGNDIYVGQLVKVVGHPELKLERDWIIFEFVDYGTAIDVVLSQFYTKEIRFIPLLDIERQV